MPQYSHYQVSRSFPTLQKIETKPIHWQQMDKVGKFTYQSTSDQHLQQSHENRKKGNTQRLQCIGLQQSIAAKVAQN